MKILFLDCDGVLNCSKRWKGPNATDLDQECLSFLKDIIVNTGAKVVVSSTWRLYNLEKEGDCMGLLDVLVNLGIEVVGVTPDLVPRSFRSKEIEHWLNNNKEWSKFAIVDDDKDAGYGLEEHFFRTSFTNGLTREIADRIIKHLTFD